MHVRRGHYIGVAPLPDGLVNACLVTEDRRGFDDPTALAAAALAADPWLGPRFARARLAQPAVSLGPLAVDARAAGMAGLLLAGDAAGFIDPMTGDGLRFAMRGAELAARVALESLEHGTGRPRAARRARRAEFARKQRFNRALRTIVARPAAVSAGALAAAWRRSCWARDRDRGRRGARMTAALAVARRRAVRAWLVEARVLADGTSARCARAARSSPPATSTRHADRVSRRVRLMAVEGLVARPAGARLVLAGAVLLVAAKALKLWAMSALGPPGASACSS